MNLQQPKSKVPDQRVEKFRRLINSSARASCPFIGLENDQDIFTNFPSDNNRCHCMPTVSEIAQHYQKDTCLSQAFITCPVYLAKEAAHLHPQRDFAKPTKSSLFRAASMIFGLK